ncbi:MAG: alpha/beta hydrolase [Methylobacteriaceae bacterium]|nr:alpha/beta hydrolase [Methylobacteriaceae bacterium]
MTEPQFAAADPPLRRIRVGEGEAAHDIALLWRDGDPARPVVVWLGGFRSDMRATKASRLDAFAAETGRAMLRFDYSGHGESGGDFEAGTIGGWLADALAAIDAAAPGRPLILVGSSMGGWMALLAARALAARGEAGRIAGVVLLAPAVDFTEALMWAGMSAAARAEVMQRGRWLRPSAYSPEPYAITRGLIEEGRRHLMLGGVIRTYAPARILQGQQDDDVPWRHAQAVAERIAADPVTLTYVRDGDHRLSREQDLALLVEAVATIA